MDGAACTLAAARGRGGKRSEVKIIGDSVLPWLIVTARPPTGALAWPGLFRITSEHPPAGTEMYRWDSVIIDIVGHGGAPSGVVPPGAGSPPPDSAHAAAAPKTDHAVNPAGDDDGP